MFKICFNVTKKNLGDAYDAAAPYADGNITIRKIPRKEATPTAQPPRKISSQGRAIIEAKALIRTLDFEWTTNQAYLACRGTNVHKSAIDRAITAMVVDGQIERLRRGVYRQPKGGNGPFNGGTEQRKGLPTEL